MPFVSFPQASCSIAAAPIWRPHYRCNAACRGDTLYPVAGISFQRTDAGKEPWNGHASRRANYHCSKIPHLTVRRHLFPQFLNFSLHSLSSSCRLLQGAQAELHTFRHILTEIVPICFRALQQENFLTGQPSDDEFASGHPADPTPARGPRLRHNAMMMIPMIKRFMAIPPCRRKTPGPCRPALWSCSPRWGPFFDRVFMIIVITLILAGRTEDFVLSVMPACQESYLQDKKTMLEIQLINADR